MFSYSHVIFCHVQTNLCHCTELLDPDVNFDVPVDVFAIGFEEIVDLNASNIVSARYAVAAHCRLFSCDSDFLSCVF